MAKKGMKRPETDNSSKNSTKPVAEIQGKEKNGKGKCNCGCHS